MFDFANFKIKLSLYRLLGSLNSKVRRGRRWRDTPLFPVLILTVLVYDITTGIKCEMAKSFFFSSRAFVHKVFPLTTLPSAKSILVRLESRPLSTERKGSQCWESPALTDDSLKFYPS